MKFYVTEVMEDCSVKIHEADAEDRHSIYPLSGRFIATTRQEALRLLAAEMHKELLRTRNREGMIKQTLDAIVALEKMRGD